MPTPCPLHPLPEPDGARRMPTLGLLPVIAISAAVAGPALAQTTGGTVQLDTIVVDGPKGNEAATEYTTTESGSDKVLTPILDTPKTIKVITRREIAERGQTSLTDILRATPGITLGTGEGGNPAGTMPSIRGNNATNDILVDGFRSPLRTEYEAFNLETVEITKGPGGTAAGTGSTGGTINLTSKTPIAGETFNDAALSFGTGAYKRATLDMNRSFGDLGLRLNLMAQDADSLYGRDGRTSKRLGLAPSLSYRIGDATTLTAGLYYYKDNDILDYGVPLTSATTETLPFARGSGTPEDPYLPMDVRTSAFYGIPERDKHEGITRSGFLRLDHEISPTLTWSTTLRKASNSNWYVVSLPNGTATESTRSNRQSSRKGEDLAFNSQLTGEAYLGGLKHTFAIGVDLSDAEVSTMGITVTNPPGFSGNTPYDDPDPTTSWAGGTITHGPATSISSYRTRAIYAFDVVELSPQWELSFGLRYDKFKAETFSVASGTVTNANSSSFWNGNLGIVYKPAGNGSVYVSVGTSANPAGEGNGVGGGPNSSLDALAPERAYSYELGTKWALFDERLFVSAALYLTRKDNARVTGFDPDGIATTQNIGRTRTQGLELDVAGQINDRWGVSAGYAYIDGKIVDGGYNCDGTVCTPSPNNGTRITATPMHSLSLWTTYAVNDRLTLGGGAQYVGKRNLNATGTVALPSHWRVDLMASYKVSETTAIRFNANNVFDEQLYSGNRGNGWANVEPGRNFSLTLAHSF